MTAQPTERHLQPVPPGDNNDRGGKAQPLLIVQNLQKYFPIRGGVLNRKVAEVKAVDDVSFSVMKGETLGIVGESGCGKSTLARLLMHLMPRDKGTLVFDGDPVDEPHGITLRELRRNMQMVFQDSYSSLNPRLPVVDSIAYGPTVHGVATSEAKIKARGLLEKVGLRPDLFGGRYPHELSGGQKQRVNIARALALDPRMLILDEAVSALDKSVEAQVLNLLGYLKRHLNLTYIFISHDLHVVQYISDRVLVMYLGQVVEIGPVDRIYNAPKHPYTRALLQSALEIDPEHRIETPPLVGDPPNPINPPSGCRFRTRCPYAEAICERETPKLGKAAENPAEHVAACHITNPVAGHSMAGRTLQSLPVEASAPRALAAAL
ncbi:ABC transporter ATP-binding protein [Chthonobacter albigriseus]|uniref:ABC transporter ATP-binding protein n=1 Tax=Chthonobacter albigriseus TaxID=1683161 RepID=UPI0015EF522C|nr:ABC transporter ATP-binding protein [Chthonobacter albigriseus]